MFSALKKLTKSNDDRGNAPVPMSSSLQKKFSRGVHFNMKILIKGDRNVGKTCLLQRLQGGPFVEEYVPTEQIQVAPIHWTYKNTDHIIKVEVWEIVDKGKAKKKAQTGLKLENQSATVVADWFSADNTLDAPVLDATFLDVYKSASGVILMLDITKPWTFDYVTKELNQVPADLPVVILGNHCDMQHHRQVENHHIEQTLQHAKQTRTAPIRYAESSMRNGFGLRLLHKFFNIPFLRLQRTSLLEQLQTNQKDIEEADKSLDEFQLSEESDYSSFVDRLNDKRRANSSQPPVIAAERSPSIVLGGGKPIVPTGVNPLLAQSLNPMGIKAVHESTARQSQFVSSDLLKPRQTVNMAVTPTKVNDVSAPSTPSANVSSANGDLDEFYAGALDSSFLDDIPAASASGHGASYDTDSDDSDVNNPKVAMDQDIDLDFAPTTKVNIETRKHSIDNKDDSHSLDKINELSDMFSSNTSISNRVTDISIADSYDMGIEMNSDYPIWAGDSSVRRSPEGGEDPDLLKEDEEKKEKKHKKKKSKDKSKGDYEQKKEKKHKHSKKSKGEKTAKSSHPQNALLDESIMLDDGFDDYDSI